MEFLNPYDAAPLTRSTFFRGVESLVIDTLTPTAIRLQFDDAPPQVMKLSDAIEAVFFQSNLEHELVRTGWTLEGVRLDARRASENPAGSIRHRQPAQPLDGLRASARLQGLRAQSGRAQAPVSFLYVPFAVLTFTNSRSYRRPPA